MYYSKSLNREIFRIAIPTFIGFTGLILFEIIDIYWIGKIGPKAVAAIGAATFIEWMVFSLMSLSVIGCSTLVSQFFGAGRTEKQFDTIRESFWLSLFISYLIMLSLWLLTSNIFLYMGLDSETHQLGMEYFNLFILGFPILYIFHLQGYVFNAYGDTKTSSATMCVALAINAALDPLLIFGKFGFPELGIKGAAIASILSQIIGILLRTYYLRKKNHIGTLASFFKFSTKHFKRLLKIGIPTAATHAVWSSVFPMLTIIITRFGMAPLAGLNIANRLEGLPYFFGLGLSTAISTLVGQNFGRGEKKKIKLLVRRGIILVTLILLPTSLAFIFCPTFLISLLNDDPEIIRHGAIYLRIVGYFEIFLGWELVIEGGMNGLGNTRPYMYLSIPLTLARVPLAWLLAINLNLGISGVWWAISITTLIKGIGVAIVFAKNKTNKRLLTSPE